jgi:hypothetical protein
VLEPGWYTYWKNPGEAGVPPVFDFSGSENVGQLEVLYPRRSGRSTSGAFPSSTRMKWCFPSHDHAAQADRPVVLSAESTVRSVQRDLHSDAGERGSRACSGRRCRPAQRARLKSFEERVPKGPVAGRFDIEKVAADGDALDIEIRMPDSSYTDLFVDPPKGWYIGQPVFVEQVDGLSRYRLSLTGRPPALP